jgi:glycerol-3-phosphate acyltransferase PlsY
MVIIQSIILILSGYLIGSIPSAYLAGKWIKGIDLRHYGSGTVSASMVWEHVAHWALFPVGIFDLLKAAIPVWLGRLLGMDQIVCLAAGMAALIGHNWPLYLGFAGGRGLSPFLGLLLAVYPWGFPWLLVFLGVGFILGDSAPWALASLILLPAFNYWMNGPKLIYAVALSMVLLTIFKRLEANRRPLPKEKKERRIVILRRIFLDRDIASHQDWINRRS